jgi:uncharacterized Rmd1/YagE family protein
MLLKTLPDTANVITNREHHERSAVNARAPHYDAGAVAWRPNRDRGSRTQRRVVDGAAGVSRRRERRVIALFRYGVAVMVGMSPLEEEAVIGRLQGRIVSPNKIREEESVQIEVAPDKHDQLLPSGIIVVKALTTEHTLLIADALATSVVLAHDEKTWLRFST